MNALPAMTNERQDSSGVDAEHPWPGLKAFTEDLQGYFHGREQETADLFRRVRREELTIIFGQSGLGKTSLLQAGLFPKLRGQGFLPVLIRLDYDDKPGASLAAQVKAAIQQAIQAAGLAQAAFPDPAEKLWEYFHRAGPGWQTAGGAPESLVLVFDQFEEFFTLGRNDPIASRSESLLEELADLVENRPPQALAKRFEEEPELVNHFAFDRQDFRVLLSLREDYLPDLEGLRRQLPSLADNRMRLLRMNGLRALEAILNAPGNHVAPEVAEKIVRFVASEEKEDVAGNGRPDVKELQALAIEPWLLSLVCFELNERRLKEGLPQITGELVAGSTKDILEKFYQTCLERRGSAFRGAVREFIEERLLSKTGFRESMALDTAWDELTRGGAPASAIDELVKERLLHVEERLGAPRVELTHDKLAVAIKHSRDERRRKEAEAQALRQVEEAAQEQVRQAEENACKAREKLRRSRTRLAVVGGCGIVLLALLVVSSFFLFEARRESARAEQEKEKAEKAQERAEQNNRDLTSANEKLEKAKKSEEDKTKKLDQARQQLGETNYKQAVALAHREWLNGNVNKWEELLTGSPPRQRGWEWDFLKNQGPREFFSFREIKNYLCTAAFSRNRPLAGIGWLG